MILEGTGEHAHETQRKQDIQGSAPEGLGEACWIAVCRGTRSINAVGRVDSELETNRRAIQQHDAVGGLVVVLFDS